MIARLAPQRRREPLGGEAATINLPIGVISFLTSEPLVLALCALTIALCIAAILVPRSLVTARNSATAAGISPLWLLLPCGAFMGALLAGTPPASEAVALGILLLQVILSVWVIYRHRRWPWIALPLAVVLIAWPVIAILAIALGSMAH